MTNAYERSLLIEKRFQKALALIKKKRLNSGQLALELGVSRPTAQRIITELKRRDHAIRSIHEEDGWSYEVMVDRRLKSRDASKKSNLRS